MTRKDDMTDRYDYRRLRIEQDGRLLTVSLNRPESMNAFGDGMHEELEDFFYTVRDDTEVGAILLTGAGRRAFSSGGDVKGMAAAAGGSEMISDAMRVGKLLGKSKRLITNMLEVEQPIVSSVHGYALGLGATVALFCDIVFAAEDAVFADTHVDIGLVAGDGGAVIWPLLLPINTAKYYLLTGERITGKQAVELGLVVKSFPDHELDRAAHEVADRLANGPVLATRWTKTAVNKILRDRMTLLFDTSLVLEGATMVSEDHREATTAFVERRSPVFRGR
jgi:enoyl-CoA hydratase